MNKKIFLILPAAVATLLLSGCSLGSGSASNTKTPPTAAQLAAQAKAAMASATFLRSDDGATTWNPKTRIDDKKTITGIDVLTMAINPQDPNNVYLGTDSNGLFQTKDGGETWAQVSFPNKAYGLVFDPRNANVMYASGVFNGRAKIFKRLAEGQEWQEIYTEPSDGTIISSLAIDPRNSLVLYAGTNEGVIIKSTDGGKTWVNLKISPEPNAPIVSIAFDSANDSHVFFAIAQAGVLETKDGGNTVKDITSQIDTKNNTTTVYTLVADPYLSGVVYVGTGNGIFKRTGDGNWNELNVIQSSKAFAVHALAINPRHSNEIIYAASKAIYKSTDTGGKWSTFQLDTNKDISILKYNPIDPSRIYAGLRSF